MSNPLITQYQSIEEALKNLKPVAIDIIRLLEEKYGNDYDPGNLLLLLAYMICGLVKDEKRLENAINVIRHLYKWLEIYRLLEKIEKNK